MLTKRKFLFLAAIVVVCAIGLWLNFGDAKHADEVHVKASELNNAFGRYDRIRGSILSGTFSEDDLGEAARTYSQQADVERLRALLESADGRKGDQQLRESLYEIHVKAEPNPDVIYDYIKEQFDGFIPNAGLDPDNRARVYAWVWSYLAKASCLAFRATGDERFLDLIVESYGKIMAHRDDRSGQGPLIHGIPVQPSWGVIKKKGDKMQYMYIVTHAGCIGFPVLLFCEIVRANPSLHDKYLRSSEMFLESIVESMAVFDASFVTDEATEGGYYVSPLRDMIEPLNHSHAAGVTLVMLYELTGDEAYRDKVVKIANYFRSCIKEERNGSYIWGYRPRPAGLKECEGEWSWKGGISVLFPLVAHEKGLAFTERDMQAFANTFLKNISPNENQFNSTIYSNDLPPSDPVLPIPRLTRFSTTSVWTFLNTVSPGVQGAFEDVIVKRTDLFPRGWFEHPAAVQAYSYKLYTHRAGEVGTVTMSKETEEP